MPPTNDPVPRCAPAPRDGSTTSLGLATEHVPVGVCMLDSDAHLLAANTACTALTGLVPGDHLLGIIVEHDRGRVRSALASAQTHCEDTVDITVTLLPTTAAAPVHVRLMAGATPTGDAQVRFACSIIDVTASVDRIEQLRHQATHDTLTGLLNRSAVEDELARRLADSARTDRVAALFLDLDGFKAVNDAYGHQVGDLLLSTVASRLRAHVRSGDAIGRLGGDEFLVITTHEATGASAGELGARLLREVTQAIPVGPSEIVPRISIGIAVEPNDGTTSERLLSDADLAMYDAKAGARGVAFATRRTRDLLSRRVAIERDLASAMSAGQVDFHLQVIRLLDTAEPLGAEALVRWTHPTHALIPPPLLIERAEAIGAIADFTIWGLDAVCAKLSALKSRVALFADKGFGVNATIRQLAIPGYVDLHLATIERHGLRAQDIIVEVTEYEAVGRGGAAEATICALADLGVPIALDDFGVGYTALDYLTRLPVDVVKVDRSLVSGIQDRPQAQVVLRGLVSMAAELGFETLAEGIETHDELAVCRDIGLRAGQGYLLGRPKPLPEFAVSDALWTPGETPDWASG